MLRATLHEPVPLQIFVPDGRTDLYARVRVLDTLCSIVTTLYPVHQAEGLYSATWTPTSEGYHNAIYELFEDAGLTIPADYDRDAEVLEVSSDKTNIIRLLGLHHENALLDQQVHAGGRLISARLRMYDSAVNLAAALDTSPAGGTTGLLFTWQISSAYDSMNLSKTFQIARVP
jgi:hypothetical protein